MRLKPMGVPLELGSDTGDERGRHVMMQPSHPSPNRQGGNPGRPYLMFWINMVLGLVVMYVVMFSMIDGLHDFRNNLNMFYMALTMWAPMGIFMLATMPGMFPPQAPECFTLRRVYRPDDHFVCRYTRAGPDR